MAFINPLNPEPLDPFYVKFRDGFGKWIIEKREYSGLRWAPWAKNGPDWIAFKLNEWDFLDFGGSDPASPLKSAPDTSGGTIPFPYKWYWDDFKGERDIPALWAEVNRTYARFKEARPQAAWSPYDGSWRDMRLRYTIGPSTGDTPDPNYPKV